MIGNKSPKAIDQEGRCPMSALISLLKEARTRSLREQDTIGSRLFESALVSLAQPSEKEKALMDAMTASAAADRRWQVAMQARRHSHGLLGPTDPDDIYDEVKRATQAREEALLRLALAGSCWMNEREKALKAAAEAISDG